MDPEKQHLESESSDNEDDQDPQIEISIKKLDGDTFCVSLSTTATVLGLKTIIHDQQNVEAELQRLIYRAQELKDDFPLSQYGISNGCTLHLVVRRNIQQQQQQNGQHAINMPKFCTLSTIAYSHILIMYTPHTVVME